MSRDAREACRNLEQFMLLETVNDDSGAARHMRAREEKKVIL